MIENIKKYAVPFTNYVVKPLLNWLTKGSTPAAKAYAEKVTQDAIDALPKAFETLEKVYNDYQKGAIALDVDTGLKFADKMMASKNETKDVFLSPLNAYHQYKNFAFLNGVEDGKLTSHIDEDDFVVLSKPTL